MCKRIPVVYNAALITSAFQWYYHSGGGPSGIASGYSLDNQQYVPVPSRRVALCQGRRPGGGGFPTFSGVDYRLLNVAALLHTPMKAGRRSCTQVRIPLSTGSCTG
jgi:hypothetical protein